MACAVWSCAGGDGRTFRLVMEIWTGDGGESVGGSAITVILIVRAPLPSSVRPSVRLALPAGRRWMRAASFDPKLLFIFTKKLGEERDQSEITGSSSSRPEIRL